VEGKRLTPRAADGTELVMPQLIVPAYFHPASHPQDWAWLAGRAARVRLVVLNLADGPGAQPDAAVLPALERLHSAGVAVAGYVDTNYGQRRADEALADLGRYLDWYQVAGVFFDRAAAAAQDVDYYAGLTRRARQAGAQVVALNHGTHPDEAYAEHADLLGTFEGPWRAYLDLAVPRWARSRPAGQFYHLPHSVPPGSFGDAFWLAARRNAGCVYVTDHGGANPWCRLPAGQFYRRAR
jgi:Spherulation-specific family 4